MAPRTRSGGRAARGALEEGLGAVRARGGKALIPYLMSGFPDPRRFRELLAAVLAERPAAIEIGLPFSDPLADGPVIQAAGQIALQQGIDLARTLDLIAPLARRHPEVPFILMSYLNPLRRFGLARAARATRAAGFRGWIVPDRDLLAPDEVITPARAAGLVVVPLVAPTTPPERLPRLLAGAGGFVYVVSVTGVTGARRGQSFTLGTTLARLLARLRERTRLPLCVGFGIASREQAAAVSRLADGIIVGSALLEPFLATPWPQARARCLELLRELAAGLAGTKALR